MSWFANDFTACTANAEPDDHHNVETRQEPAPGVTIQRRSLFRIGGAAALALLVGPGVLRSGKAGASEAGEQFGPLNLEEFIAQADPLARALAGGTEPNEEAYLLHLASLLCRLGPQPLGAERPRRMMRSHYYKPHFAVMQINMAPDAVLPYHDHRDYNGVILGLEGSVRARNFEILGDDLIPPGDKQFQIRQTADTVLEPGRISTLTRRRDNIHDLRAGTQGARLLDVFTFFPGSQGSHYLEVDETPLEDRPAVFTARWRA